MKILTIKIKVKDEIEAYQIVSRIGFEHKIYEADFDGRKETFNSDNQPNMFLKDNNKINKNIFKKLI